MLTDTDKIGIIDTMIADFWEGLTSEQQESGAICLINAIATIINIYRKE